MKYIRLIAFFYLFMTGSRATFCQSASIFKDLSLDYSTVYKGDLNNSLKFSLPFLELRGALRYKELKAWPPDYNLGVMLTSLPFYKPLSLLFKGGNLSANGSLSLLNSPSFSQEPSPFGLDTAISIENMGASLPAKDIFTKPYSYFFELDYKGKSFFQSAAINFFSDGSSTAGGTGFKITAGKKVDFSFAYTAGIFPLEKMKNDSWYFPRQYYAGGSHICMNWQAGFSAGAFKSLFTLCNYESPFSIYERTFRLQNQLRLKHFSTLLDIFYNPNENLITSSGKLLSPSLQFHGGSMIKFSSLTGGLTFLADINPNDKKHKLKSQSGIKYEGKIYSATITSSLNLLLTSNAQGLEIQCSGGNLQNTNKICIKGFSAEVSPDFSFERNTKGNFTFTEKIRLLLEYKGLLTLTAKSNFNLKHKEAFKDRKFYWDTKISLEGKIGFFGISLSLEVDG